MRIQIAYEGLPTEDGRLILPGALAFPDHPVPVTVPGPDGRLILLPRVRAADFERTADGSIWATIGLSPQLEIRDATWEDGPDDAVVITSGTIATVHLGTRPAWRSL